MSAVPSWLPAAELLRGGGENSYAVVAAELGETWQKVYYWLNRDRELARQRKYRAKRSAKDPDGARADHRNYMREWRRRRPGS